jgi:hypothetical protein
MPTIDAREAVESAVKYLNSMRDLVDSKLQDIRLEEIELSEDQLAWVVTLGYTVPAQPSGIDRILNPPHSSLFNNAPAYVKRDYKIFQVNSKTGGVQSMKIRTLS